MRLCKYEQGKKALCFLDMPSVNHKFLFKELNNEKNCYVSCIKDNAFKAKFFKCEIGASAFVLALLARLCDNCFDELDEAYLSAESCIAEEEAFDLLDFLKEADFIVFDENLKKHKDYENIKFFLSFLAKKFNLKLANSANEEGEFKCCEFKELKALDNYDGLVVLDSKLDDKFFLCSKQFLNIAKAKNEDILEFKLDGASFKAKLCLNDDLQGTVALLNINSKDFAFKKLIINS